MCVRKVFLNGSKTWPVVTEDVQQLVLRVWYHLYNLKNLKNTHGGELFLIELQAFSLHFY